MANGYGCFHRIGQSLHEEWRQITTDLSDCQPDGITIPEIDFCSFQDVVKMTLKLEGFLAPETAILSRVACSPRLSSFKDKSLHPWAFSSIGGLEDSWEVATGQLQSLSEQQLVDCSKQNCGFNGGLRDYAFDY